MRVAQTTPERLERSWPADPQYVAAARAAVSEFAVGNGASRIDLAGLKLAVSEAVSNVVLHAYRGSATGRIHLAAAHRPDGLHVVVSDQGGGMLPRTDSPGSGFGLSLIAQSADGVEIGRTAGGGTTVLMRFRT